MPLNTIAVNHVGLAVRDLDRSLAFYREVFAAEPYHVGTDSGPGLSQQAGLPNAFVKYANLTVHNVDIELLEYVEPRGAENDRRNCDVGMAHVCFEVSDIYESYGQLRALGVEVGGPPVVLGPDQGPFAGVAYFYFQDPDGLQYELFQAPPDK